MGNSSIERNPTLLASSSKSGIVSFSFHVWSLAFMIPSRLAIPDLAILNQFFAQSRRFNYASTIFQSEKKI
jgi:hypothetical protein